MELQEGIIETAKEIFSTMLMVEISEKAGGTDESINLDDNVSGVIGLAGTHKGVLAIHLPNITAKKLTASFLGMGEDEVEDDIDDAVGEIANMLGGNVKSLLSSKGRDIELSLPSIIKGKGYTFHTKGNVERIVIPFSCDAGEFTIEFQLEC